MDADERRQFNMLVRVRDFGAENAADFPEKTAGAAAFAEVAAAIADAEQADAEQTSGFGQGRQGLENKFRLARSNRNDSLLLTSARAFAQDAESLAAKFVEYGLPNDFIDDLNQDIAKFEAAVNTQNQAADQHTAATVAIDRAIERGLLAVRRLNAVVPNKYRSDAAKLAAWTSASHTERAPRAAKTRIPPAS